MKISCGEIKLGQSTTIFNNQSGFHSTKRLMNHQITLLLLIGLFSASFAIRASTSISASLPAMGKSMELHEGYKLTESESNKCSIKDVTYPWYHHTLSIPGVRFSAEENAIFDEYFVEYVNLKTGKFTCKDYERVLRARRARCPNNSYPCSMSVGSYAPKVYVDRATQNQDKAFPPKDTPSYPLIEKVLYGKPRHNKDLTYWFRNYLLQSTKNGRIQNLKNVNWNVYGDP